MPAQALVQTGEGSRGALLFHACMPPKEFGDAWPAGVPAQVHFMEDYLWAEEDLPAAHALSSAVDEVELFLYPGAGHGTRGGYPSFATSTDASWGLVWNRARPAQPHIRGRGGEGR